MTLKRYSASVEREVGNIRQLGDARLTDPDGDPLTYTIKQCSKYVDGNETVVNANFVQTGPGTFDLTAPSKVGVWKVYVYVYDGQGNVGIEPRSLGVVP